MVGHGESISIVSRRLENDTWIQEGRHQRHDGGHRTDMATTHTWTLNAQIAVSILMDTISRQQNVYRSRTPEILGGEELRDRQR